MNNKVREEAGISANEQAMALKRYRGKLNEQKVLLRREEWKSMEPFVNSLEKRIRELKSRALASVKPFTSAELVSFETFEIAFDSLHAECYAYPLLLWSH